MTALRDRSRLMLFGLLATAVYGVEVLAAHTALPRSSSPGLLAAAIAFDLLVAVPALYWWLCVRGRATAWRVMPILLLGLAGAASVLPVGYDGIFSALRLLAVPAELVVLGLVARRVVRSLRGPAAPDDVPARLRHAAREVLPARAVADAVAFEMALLWFALAGGWRRAAEDEAAFSYHRRSGYGGVLFALGVASLVEMVAVHLLVARWSAGWAWGLTGLGAYGVLWMTGDYQAVRLRPVRADADALRVRAGLRWSVEVPWHEVAAVEPRGRRTLAREAGYLRAALLGEPRLVLELRRPVVAHGPYGLTREVTRIGLSVDDEPRFLRAVEARTAPFRREGRG